MKNHYKKILMLILIVIALAVEFIVIPNIISNKQIVEYSNFLFELKNGTITEVEICDDKIIFRTNNSNNNVFETIKLENDEKIISRLEYTPNIVFYKNNTYLQDKLKETFLQWVIPWIILFALFKGMSKITKKDGTSTFWESTKLRLNDSDFNMIKKCDTSFLDVAGQNEAKGALLEIVDYLHNPTKYISIGAKIPKGILLVGSPGTGKTLIAKAVAGEAGVPFFSISGSEFVEMYAGMGAARVRELFQKARTKAPCIIFIDEVDTIGKKRDSGVLNSMNDEREQTLNQLLIEMDGFNDKSNIIVLAATNRPDSLDSALLRPGRFDRTISLELPDLMDRIKILKVHTKNVKMDNNIDIDMIAKVTSGASGAELANIVNEAALRAVRLNREFVTQEDFCEAIDIATVGYQKKNSTLSEENKLIVAYHEIGHALVIALLTKEKPVHKITIIPRTSGTLGYTLQVENTEKILYSKEDLFKKIVALTAGRAAEEIIYGYYTTGASNDMDKATQLARKMVTKFGMSDYFDMMVLETETNSYLDNTAVVNCSMETSRIIDEEVLTIIKKAHNEAVTLLKNNKGLLIKLSTYLYEKETISGSEFIHLIKMEAENNEK